MRDETIKYKIFSRRAFILSGIKFALITTILGRYYYLQITKSDKYKFLAERNRVKISVIQALRGKILDRNSVEICDDSVHFRLCIVGLNINKQSLLIPQIQEILGRSLKINDEQLRRRNIKRNRNDPLILEDNLSWEDLSKIQEKNYLIPGIEVIEGQIRNYKFSDVFAHITGYIGNPTEEEVEKYAIPSFSDFKIGKSGLEKTFDVDLRGQPGVRKTEVDVHGIFVREIEKEEPITGKNLKITVDSNLQQLIHDLMLERNMEGAVVVLDAKTVGVIALHSTPTFNPNNFVDGVSQEYWSQLTQHKSNPLINTAISIPFPPGSTFKLIT